MVSLCCPSLAWTLRGHQGLNVYTNDLDVARILALAGAKIVMLGGEVDVREMATVGLDAAEQAERYNVDISVISAGGLTAQHLVTDFSRDCVGLRDRILRSGRTGYIIADHEKFGVVGQFGLPTPKAGTCLVMDRSPPADVIAALKEKGLSHIVANSE